MQGPQSPPQTWWGHPNPLTKGAIPGCPGASRPGLGLLPSPGPAFGNLEAPSSALTSHPHSETNHSGTQGGREVWALEVWIWKAGGVVVMLTSPPQITLMEMSPLGTPERGQDFPSSQRATSNLPANATAPTAPLSSSVSSHTLPKVYPVPAFHLVAIGLLKCNYTYRPIPPCGKPLPVLSTETKPSADPDTWGWGPCSAPAWQTNPV